jgi:hypothetical protein
MCAGALYWSGIGRLVYALGEDELSELIGKDPENPTMALSSLTVLGAGQRTIQVVGPVDLPAAPRGARRILATAWTFITPLARRRTIRRDVETGL